MIIAELAAHHAVPIPAVDRLLRARYRRADGTEVVIESLAGGRVRFRGPDDVLRVVRADVFARRYRRIDG